MRLLLAPALLGVILTTARDAAAVASPGLWIPAADMAIARERPTATLLASGKVLVAGGNNSLTNYLNVAELYDPPTDRWSPAAPLAIGRSFQTATRLLDGRVLVAGGYGDPGGGNANLKSVEIYDPAANTWTTVAPMTTARRAHTATLLNDGRVLVAGGVTGPADDVVAGAEIYSPAANTWTPAASLARPREYHTATLLADGSVLVAGGFDGDYVGTAERYVPASNTWALAGTLAQARRLHTATRLDDGRVLVAGGGGAAGYLDSAEIYTPGLNAWSPVASMTGARSGHDATLLRSGEVLVTGGVNASTTLATAETYDPIANSWSPAGVMTNARVRHAAARLDDGAVLVAGGAGASYLNSAEIWDPDGDGDGLADRYEIAPGCPGTPFSANLGPRTQMTRPCDPDTDGDGFRDKPAAAHSRINADALLDNCPAAANPSQLNTDGNFVDLPPSRPFDDLTWPMSDARGDVCDDDDDNDGLADAAELAGPPCASASAPTDPLLRDTDGDRVLDGAECALGTDPANAASKPPYAPAGDADRDGLADSFEPSIGSDPAVSDTDGDGLFDGVEFKYYASDPLAPDSDRDGCADGKEVAGVNNDAVVTAGDIGTVASAFGLSSSPAYVLDFDTNKDGSITAGDIGFTASKFGPC